MSGSRTWPPTRFLRFVEAYDTSVETAQIVTDAGVAYVKALGNKSGPHALACELVGTRLARWFDLRTFEDGILVLTEADEITFLGGGRAEPGPAFVTRGESGQPWDGDPDTLRQIDNPEDLSRLVVFDTWVLNWDRCSPDLARRPKYDNVFLSAEGATAGRFLLKAMDHTHCLGCRTGELTLHTGDIDQVRDERAYGLFPGFRPWIREGAVRQACAALRQLDRRDVVTLVGSIPREWQVSDPLRLQLIELIVRRAAFVAEHFEAAIRRLLATG